MILESMFLLEFDLIPLLELYLQSIMTEKGFGKKYTNMSYGKTSHINIFLIVKPLK